MLNGLRINHSSLILWTLLIMSTSSKIRKSISDASMVSNLLEKIIKPYVDSNQIIAGRPRQRTEKDITIKNLTTVIKKVIKRNVLELKPILQENELNDNTKIETNNNLKLEGNDETTIIELVPENNRKANAKKTKELSDTFQRKIENYKQLRHNISILLKNVKTDSSTKKLITKTLDDMLTLLIERQCNVKNEDKGEVINQLLKDSRKSNVQSIQKVGQKKDLDNLKEGYWAPFKGLELHDETNRPSIALEDIKNFIYQILLNSWNVVDQYRVSCYLRYKDKPVETDGSKCSGGTRCKMITAQPRSFAKSLDRDSKYKNKSQCDNWLVCTEELSAFLTKTYKSLNDTTVDTFRTYASMYMTDVRTANDIVEDSVVYREIEAIRVSAEIKVHKIFMEEMDQFTKDALKTKKDVTIQLMKNFIIGMISQVKSGLYTLVIEKLNEKPAIFSRIKDDLLANLRIEMDNLNEQIADKICGSFVLCNGKPNGNGTRRFSKRNFTSNKDVYVQLEIALDDKLKDSLASYTHLNLESLPGFNNFTVEFTKNIINKYRRWYSNVNVTRTTVGSTAKTHSSENGKTEQFF